MSHMLKSNLIFCAILILALTASACNVKPKDKSEEDEKTQVKTGIEVLQHTDFDILQNKRVGLVTNQTGVDRYLNSTTDILYQSELVNLVALFGPEHGVRGNFSAGDQIGNQTDPKTGLAVYSLYGSDKKPNAKVLEDIDILVYDIQDIGVRSYTYISTMGLVMEAAAENNIEVVILDRPNPLGGNRVEGPGVEEEFYSFISQYNIPYVYGLSCGELAIMLNEERMLSNGVQCKLTVIPMEGWSRNMSYDKTGLLWVPSSPHIPDYMTAFYYACTGIIGEIDPNLIGIGYTLPFQTLVTNSINADQLAEAMNNLELPGVLFRPIYYKPYYKSKAGQELQGVQIHITDLETVCLTEIQFYFLQEASRIDSDYSLFSNMESRYRMFDLGCGTDTIRTSLMLDPDFEKIKPLWRTFAEGFKKKSEAYYLYE